MIDITPLIEAVLALIAVLITANLVPWIKSQIMEKQREEINAWVKIAVQAAEQLCNSGKLGDKDAKKQYVIDFLAQKSLKIDLTELDKMIEAAVLEINKGGL